MQHFGQLRQFLTLLGLPGAEYKSCFLLSEDICLQVTKTSDSHSIHKTWFAISMSTYCHVHNIRTIITIEHSTVYLNLLHKLNMIISIVTSIACILLWLLGVQQKGNLIAIF